MSKTEHKQHYKSSLRYHETSVSRSMARALEESHRRKVAAQRRREAS